MNAKHLTGAAEYRARAAMLRNQAEAAEEADTKAVLLELAALWEALADKMARSGAPEPKKPRK